MVEFLAQSPNVPKQGFGAIASRFRFRSRKVASVRIFDIRKTYNEVAIRLLVGF